jgi:hypothetical protein
MIFIPAEDDDGEKATNHRPSQNTRSHFDPGGKITAKQKEFLISLYMKKNGKAMPLEEEEKISNLSFDKASTLITKWKTELEQPTPEVDIDEVSWPENEN